MQLLTLKNRCKEPFIGRFDGQTYEIKDQVTLPDFIARHIRNQSYFLDNPVTGERHFRLAIIEDGDDDSPVKEIPVESLDRTDMPLSKVRIVDYANRAPAPQRREGGSAVTAKERG